MTMQNPDKPILAKDLNDYHNKILPYLGGMPEVLANKFAKGDLYDTNEKMIGKWIDGKPLYQKVIDFGALPNNTSKSVAHNIANVDIIIITDSLLYDTGTSSQQFYTIPYVATGSNISQYNIDIYANATDVIINAQANRSNWRGYITLKYTKTTDSANSFNIGEATDYSTEEKIVGTWIDGSYIYQKTYVFHVETLSGNENDITIDSDTTKHVINGFGIIEYVTYSNYGCIPCSDRYYHQYISEDNGIKLRIHKNSGASNINGNYWITVQYTKRTT